MGGFSLRSDSLIPAVSEIIGYKSGLALSREQILEHLRDSRHIEIFAQPGDAFIRMRSEVFESIVLELLYKLGRIDSPQPIFPISSVWSKYRDDPVKSEVALDLAERFNRHMRDALDSIDAKTKAIDPTPFLDEALEKHGGLGAQIAIELCETTNAALDSSPWAKIRSIEWKDIRDLQELFESESLASHHGQYFDQRFIDYLSRNFKRIEQINWRQFEGLTAEFFDRLGCRVELGPGRNDGGIDIRVWPSEDSADLPPAILVQCKREKKKISKVVVKALYADILNEKATSGLIVTATSLSVGAEKVVAARGYPIEQANRETLRGWIEAMRIPGAGVFLGE